mmetsp:Transcript_100434/g.261796  ORF Transcript_100434/g.261796 Transcript_100434/m.261796 type:complete len:123 (-) Transcript_100434:524-892(-)
MTPYEGILTRWAMSTLPLTQLSNTSGGKSEPGTEETETEEMPTMLEAADSQKAAQLSDAFWKKLTARPDTATWLQEEKSHRDSSTANVCPPTSLVRHCPIPPAVTRSGGAPAASLRHQCRSQ